MKKIRLTILLTLLVVLSTLFAPLEWGEVKDPEQSLLTLIQQNRTVVTCYDKHDAIWGGQGTITKVDSSGVYITTAEHVAHDASYCDVEYRDGSVHTAHVYKEFDKSDVAILISEKSYWRTQSTITNIKMGEKIYAFGEITQSPIFDSSDGTLLGFMFNFNDKLYDGSAISRIPPQLIVYPANKSNLVLTNIYSHPGSSGGGVFDKQGNLVALVSGGSAVDSYITYVVDLQKSYDEEMKKEVTNVQSSSR